MSPQRRACAAHISAVVTTYGVGEFSAIASVAGAYAERVPVVCIILATLLTALFTWFPR
jgi:indolepyruvate decarboxylase